MKVLHITNNYPSEKFPIFGIFVKEQISSLDRRGIKNHVFFINTREKGKYHYLPSIIRLFSHLVFNKYQVIHCHHAYSGLVLLLSGGIFFKKTVVSYQSNPKIEGGKKLFKILHLFANKIIFKNSVAEFDLYSKTELIPNGVNIDFFKPIDRDYAKEFLNLDKSKKYILFMDSYERRPYKRVDRFDDVMKVLKNKYNHHNLEAVKLTNTERNKIPYFINSCNVHLLTSDIEGSPNSVKECLACNIPVVSTPVGDTLELMKNVNGSFVSSTFEIDELSALVNKALMFEETNGRKVLIERKLDSNSVALKIESIYRNLLNEKK